MQDKSLAGVQETEKWQSYASVVEKSCSKQDHSGGEEYKNAVQAEDRSRNVIIHGVEDNSAEVLEEKVNEILSHFGENSPVVQC